MVQVECIVDCKNVLGEAVLWSVEEQKVYWVDIEKAELWALDPETKEVSTFRVPERMTAFALREKGGLVAAFESGFAFFDPRSGATRKFKDIETDLPATRLNDGRCDRQGRFIVGGFDESGNGSPISKVYRLDPDLSVHPLISNVTCANSICFSPDGKTMYFADTPVGKIWAYDYDTAMGNISNRRLFFDFDAEPGSPDGSTIDWEGYLWNAQWNGHRVVRYRPDGSMDQVLEMPVMNPTCVAFGGKDLDTLFVTTARYLMTPEQIQAEPLSGGLFAAKVDYRGLMEPKFFG